MTSLTSLSKVTAITLPGARLLASPTQAVHAVFPLVHLLVIHPSILSASPDALDGQQLQQLPAPQQEAYVHPRAHTRFPSPYPQMEAHCGVAEA